jgi:CubicO group peptidase (beta-lactamase class C family)
MRTQSPSAAVDATLRQLTRRAVPSLVAVIVEGDRVLAEHAVGVADIAARRAATPETVYMWFSMTKIVTATAAMQLVDRGRLRLDDPVSRHVREFPHPTAGWPDVQVRHLLSHSSGLANPVPLRWLHAADQPGPEPHAWMLDLLRRYSKLGFPAGSRAKYTNLGYIVLGEVISACSGQSYEDYVRENILEPLGMRRTDFGYSSDMRGDAATGYQSRLSPMTPLFRHTLPAGIVGANHGRFLSLRPFCVDGAAYGGLIGSPRDAARFMSAHLNGGQVDGVQLLSLESTTKMQTIVAEGRPRDVGLGWFRKHADSRRGERYLEHLGGGGGFFNMMRIHSDSGRGVIVMGNATRYGHERVAASALGLGRTGAPTTAFAAK